MVLDELKWEQSDIDDRVRVAYLQDAIVLHCRESGTYDVFVYSPKQAATPFNFFFRRVDALTALCLVTELMAGRYPDGNGGSDDAG